MTASRFKPAIFTVILPEPACRKVTSDTPLQVISMQAPYFDGSDRLC
ncbi:MAG: hypothetical protein R2794_08215 [Chitinophagales bacterium]